MTKLSKEQLELRQAAEADLLTFIRLIDPTRVLGKVHEDVIRWWTREEAKSHQLLLLPRDHQKSALIAFRAAWEITRNPAIRILYLSATSTLASKQLFFIKNILTSPRYRLLWPEMIKEQESKREKWTETEISVDHPLRRAERVRDPSIFTAGLTTTIIGLHFDIIVCDDVVVDNNANTDEGRQKVKSQVSYLASILGTDGKLYAVGTRYHPKDQYDNMLSITYPVYDEDGNEVGSESLYEVFERQVENNGDGTGEFLWPRQQRYDGKWFGFDRDILAKKRAQYADKTQFRAQYYNNPNDLSESTVLPDMFQYYDRKQVTRGNDGWYVRGQRVNVFAAIDFAYSLSKQADYTCIVVVGVDAQYNYYILDIDRFKTNKVSEYFQRILSSHSRWRYSKIQVEVTAAQDIIAETLKNDYIRPNNLALSIVKDRPGKDGRSKEERIESTLQPKYSNNQMWHYSGGNCELLEEELVMNRPPHDDIKDALAAAVSLSVAPTRGVFRRSLHSRDRQKMFHPRFGGVANFLIGALGIATVGLPFLQNIF